MSEPIFTPATIFLYALEHSFFGRVKALRQEMTRKVQDIFHNSEGTVNRWASPNDSTKRRNPIEACGCLFTLFFTYCRPAAFMVMGYFQELELRHMSEPLSPVEKFQPRELIQEMRQALRLVEDLEARAASDREYVTVLAEMQALSSIHTQRIAQANLTPSDGAPLATDAMRLSELAPGRRYVPAGWRANSKV